MRAIVFLLIVGCGGEPHIGKCHPDFGSLGGGDDIKVMGAGFASGLSVRMGGKSARVVSVTDDVIEVQTPPGGSPGPVDVEVVTANGKALLKRAAFRYVEEGQNPVE